MYIYVYTYVCIRVWIYTYICIPVCIYMYMRAHIDTGVGNFRKWVHMKRCRHWPRVYLCLYMGVHVYIYIYMYVYIYISVYIYICVYICNTHTYIYRCWEQFQKWVHITCCRHLPKACCRTKSWMKLSRCMLQSVVVCCSVTQCAAVCCSVV